MYRGAAATATWIFDGALELAARIFGKVLCGGSALDIERTPQAGKDVKQLKEFAQNVLDETTKKELWRKAKRGKCCVAGPHCKFKNVTVEDALAEFRANPPKRRCPKNPDTDEEKDENDDDDDSDDGVPEYSRCECGRFVICAACSPYDGEEHEEESEPELEELGQLEQLIWPYGVPGPRPSKGSAATPRLPDCSRSSAGRGGHVHRP